MRVERKKEAARCESRAASPGGAYLRRCLPAYGRRHSPATRLIERHYAPKRRALISPPLLLAAPHPELCETRRALSFRFGRARNPPESHQIPKRRLFRRSRFLPSYRQSRDTWEGGFFDTSRIRWINSIFLNIHSLTLDRCLSVH